MPCETVIDLIEPFCTFEKLFVNIDILRLLTKAARKLISSFNFVSIFNCFWVTSLVWVVFEKSTMIS